MSDASRPMTCALTINRKKRTQSRPPSNDQSPSIVFLYYHHHHQFIFYFFFSFTFCCCCCCCSPVCRPLRQTQLLSAASGISARTKFKSRSSVHKSILLLLLLLDKSGGSSGPFLFINIFDFKKLDTPVFCLDFAWARACVYRTWTHTRNPQKTSRNRNRCSFTHQLLTWRMVRPVSWASCFFWSSDGYGCYKNGAKKKRKIKIIQLITQSFIRLNVSFRKLLSQMKKIGPIIESQDSNE